MPHVGCCCPKEHAKKRDVIEQSPRRHVHLFGCAAADVYNELLREFQRASTLLPTLAIVAIEAMTISEATRAYSRTSPPDSSRISEPQICVSTFMRTSTRYKSNRQLAVFTTNC